MATVKVTNLKNVTSAIKKQIVKASRDKSIRLGIGELIVSDIQATTFRTLGSSEAYYKFRLRIKNKKDPKFTPTKINLTITGRLLKDIKSNVRVNTTGGEIRYIIEHSDKNHPQYSLKNTRKNTKKADSVPYKTIQQGLSAAGYDYLKFSDRQLAKLSKFINNSLIKLLT